MHLTWVSSRGWRGAVLLVFAFLAACSGLAEEKDQILFLQLKLKDEAITLVRSSVRPGHLKTPIAPDKKGEIRLELTAADGSSLWHEVMADPTVRRIEYEDPDNPGSLKSKEVRVTEAEFTVRVPFVKAAKQLNLHRLEKPARRADAQTPRQAGKLLGVVALPPAGETP